MCGCAGVRVWLGGAKRTVRAVVEFEYYELASWRVGELAIAHEECMINTDTSIHQYTRGGGGVGPACSIPWAKVSGLP